MQTLQKGTSLQNFKAKIQLQRQHSSSVCGTSEGQKVNRNKEVNKNKCINAI